MVPPKTVAVPSQKVPVVAEYDVIVCGGGPAGIAAAVGAARGGARTILVEQLASLGGTATAAFVGAYMDSPGGPLFDELVARLIEVGAARWDYNPERHHKPGRVRFHTETLKPVALKLVKDAGGDVLFCTFAVSAYIFDERVCGVFVANKGGRSLLKAHVVIDATADGDIAASAGAEFLKGDTDDGRIQHVSFDFDMEGVARERSEREKPADEALIEKIRAAHRSGRLHPPKAIFRPSAECFPFDLPERRLFLDAWELDKVDPTDPVAVSTTLAECQLAAFEVVQFCRENLPGYEKCRIARFPQLLGTRESRRIVGGYVLTKEDVLSASKFDDGIAKASFFIDFHDSPPGIGIPFTLEYIRANRPAGGDWYEIPYRCLVPKKVKGLLIAGRCISADRSAQASLRVMPTCMFTGTAAGAAAAMSVSRRILPHELDGREVRRTLFDK